VLQLGETASRYAQNLIELASGRSLPVALAAAERSTLAQRVSSILDPARERERASRKSLALVCVALAALIIPLSAMQQRDEAQKQEEGSSKKIRLGGNVMQAKLIHKVTPAYPADAKVRRSQGEVELDVVIDREGAVKSISVVSSPDTVLSDAAQEAVSQWRYETTLLNGKPIEVETTVMVNFTLSQ
jgi:TonB family protein